LAGGEEAGVMDGYHGIAFEITVKVRNEVFECEILPSPWKSFFQILSGFCG